MAASTPSAVRLVRLASAPSPSPPATCAAPTRHSAACRRSRAAPPSASATSVSASVSASAPSAGASAPHANSAPSASPPAARASPSSREAASCIAPRASSASASPCAASPSPSRTAASAAACAPAALPPLSSPSATWRWKRRAQCARSSVSTASTPKACSHAEAASFLVRCAHVTRREETRREEIPPEGGLALRIARRAQHLCQAALDNELVGRRREARHNLHSSLQWCTCGVKVRGRVARACLDQLGQLAQLLRGRPQSESVAGAHAGDARAEARGGDHRALWRASRRATAHRGTDRQTGGHFGRKTHRGQLGCCATHLRHTTAPWQHHTARPTRGDISEQRLHLFNLQLDTHYIDMRDERDGYRRLETTGQKRSEGFLRTELPKRGMSCSSRRMHRACAGRAAAGGAVTRRVRATRDHTQQQRQQQQQQRQQHAARSTQHQHLTSTRTRTRTAPAPYPQHQHPHPHQQHQLHQQHPPTQQHHPPHHQHHASAPAAGTGAPLPAGGEAVVHDTEAEVQDVGGRREVETLLRALDHEAEEEGACEGVEEEGDDGDPAARKRDAHRARGEEVAQRQARYVGAAEGRQHAQPQPEVHVEQRLHAHDLADDERRVEPLDVEHGTRRDGQRRGPVAGATLTGRAARGLVVWGDNLGISAWPTGRRLASVGCSAAEAVYLEPRDQPAPDPARCFDCPVDPAPAAQ
eukprot:scaffold25122_cov66-Phaeocystis_antarctica.AAC.8